LYIKILITIFKN